MVELVTVGVEGVFDPAGVEKGFAGTAVGATGTEVAATGVAAGISCAAAFTAVATGATEFGAELTGAAISPTGVATELTGAAIALTGTAIGLEFPPGAVIWPPYGFDAVLFPLLRDESPGFGLSENLSATDSSFDVAKGSAILRRFLSSCSMALDILFCSSSRFLSSSCFCNSWAFSASSFSLLDFSAALDISFAAPLIRSKICATMTLSSPLFALVCGSQQSIRFEKETPGTGSVMRSATSSG
ncbi:MAG: hypothetical protein WDM70_06585 [Nitrosomonadales bacterium]